MEFTVLYDNRQLAPGTSAEWGFSCLIEGLEKTILFDTGGKGDILLGNMEVLGKDPSSVDIVMISHDHWDHQGGLGPLLKRNRKVDTVLLSSFSEKTRRTCSMSRGETILADVPTKICDGAVTTGEISAAPVNEHGLIMAGTGPNILITGCAHPNIVRMTKTALDIIGAPVHVVLGGFHMGSMGSSEVGSAIDRLLSLGVVRAGPCHCTGDRAIRIFRDRFKADLIEIGTGAVFDI